MLLRAFRASRDPFLRAEIVWRLAETLRAQGRFASALTGYWRAHALYRRCGVQSERLRTLLGASACLRILNRFSEAQRMWRTVESSSWAKPHITAEALLEQALVERGLGNHAAAGKILRRCIAAFTKERDLEPLRHAWWALAGVERFSGRFRPALEAFRKAEGLARRLGDRDAEAYALCGEAACHRLLGDKAPAFSKYKRAHGIFVRLKDRFGEAYGLCGMANALRVYGDPRRCLPLYRKSAKLYAQVGDQGSRAFALWGEAGVWLRLNLGGDARRLYAAALSSFRKVGDERGVIMALLGQARAASSAGEAGNLLRRAERSARRARLPYETALARLEASRISSTEKTKFAILAPFGILPKTIKSWRDIP